MIKKIIALLSAVVLVMSMLSACGGNGSDNADNNNVVNNAENIDNNTDGKDNTIENPVGNSADIEYISEMNTADYVTLGDYKGIELAETMPSVSEEYVEQYINSYVLTPMAVVTPVEDRTDVREGDTVNIDYTGYKDGVAFDGGTAQGYDLTIGSGTFIPGFEEGLIGSNVGETVSLDLTFPENYRSAELAGASVVFEVTINSISLSEVPELTDELVQKLGIEDCSTPQEFRSYLYDNFYKSAQDSYNNAVKNDMSDAVMANCIFKEELPEKLIDRYYDILLDNMSMEASSYGMDLNTYMENNYSMNEEAYTRRLRDNAKTMAKQFIMFQAIADTEGLNMTDEELSAAREAWAADYGYESVDALLEVMGEETCDEYLMAEKVMEFLIDNAVINEN